MQSYTTLEEIWYTVLAFILDKEQRTVEIFSEVSRQILFIFSITSIFQPRLEYFGPWFFKFSQDNYLNFMLKMHLMV